MPRIQLSQLTVRACDSSPTARFAVDELQRYLHRLTGATIGHTLDPALPPNTLLLGSATAPTAGNTLPSNDYRIEATAGGVTLRGGSARDLLDAVYALLTQCGCRWSLLPEIDEYVPRMDGSIDVESAHHAAPFRIRGYTTDIMTWHYTQPEALAARLPDDRHFIDWMGKSGANTFLFIRHPFDTQLTIPELLPTFAERGIDVEYGGHVIPLLLPREEFAIHPQYFPVNREGERSQDANVCTSNDDAMRVVRANAMRYVQEYPEQSALHIWGADVFTGAWCSCEACRPFSVQDQNLRVCNAVAAALNDARLSRPVCYLAYHDTIDPHLSIAPAPGVVCEFAPRERCYGHALDASTCATNRRYAAALEGYVERFGAERVRVFEYYGDAILYFGCGIGLTHVIEADLAYFRKLCIRDVLMLQFGRFSAFAYAPNFHRFAARTSGIDEGPLCETYWASFGEHATMARRALAQLEATWSTIATYGDVRLAPRQPERAKKVAHAIDGATPALAAAADMLLATRDEHLRDLGLLARYGEMVLEGVAHEARTGEPADAVFARALELAGSIEARRKGSWGEHDLPMIHSLYAAARFML